MSIKQIAPKFILCLIVLLTFFSTAYAEKATPKAFVYTEVQNSVPFDKIPWKTRNPIISSQPGFISKTWLSGYGNNSVGGIYSFDSIENAQKYVTEFFPNAVKKQGVAHASRIFNAVVVEEANRDIGSVHFGGKIAIKPSAFVYTEIQVNLPFKNVPWQRRNPIHYNYCIYYKYNF